MPDYPSFIESLNGECVECFPLCRQPYINCYIEAGSTSHPIDTIFLRFNRDNDDPTTYFLRPDEAIAISWVLNGAVWSTLLEEVAT